MTSHKSIIYNLLQKINKCFESQIKYKFLVIDYIIYIFFNSILFKKLKKSGLHSIYGLFPMQLLF
ncbi:MAG: hypothetical protein CVU09_15765 [Bacteroidetes bacterium HGW-Bacteroidetes-4]|nr:MAG: hypothetical protein CVU09_15765 [Bacteroidetes bacterium HGW-Bacteroidetes-4]